MALRWRMLALLFVVRAAMGFQFQLVGALSPLYVDRYGVDLASVGLLIGLYLAPGLVFALPGGALAARFGDRRIVLIGLAMMTLGGALALADESYASQIAARVIAGSGGVILNVLLSKMAADWFTGREIGTAMALYVNSWPVGVAAALTFLPLVADAGGLSAAIAATVLYCGAAWALLAVFHRAPPNAAGAATALSGVWPRGAALYGVLAAACVWGFYNAALGIVFSFGALVLGERGFALAAASATTGLVLWVMALVVPLGGVLADKVAGRDLVIGVSLALFAVGLVVARTDLDPRLTLALLGVFAGLPAGPIMSLPSFVAPPEARAAGMGLFYTVYYATMLSAPYLAGLFAEQRGFAGATFDFGVGALVVAVAMLGAFRLFEQRCRKSA